MKKSKILAIETSCDDTCVAVVNSDYEILENLVSSQMEHDKFGGVVPEIASRLHLKKISSLVQKAYANHKDIDAVAVSVNPGLIGCLLVGVSFAKAFAYANSLPLIAVNHIIGHIYANKIVKKDLTPPYIALVVSGGHTELVHFKSNNDYEIVGRSVDDAAGETFDKAAKLLNLAYPGGPVIDKIAQNGNPNFFAFPQAFKQKNNYNFSYSGLKTAIKNYLNSLSEEFIKNNLADISASVQYAICNPLVEKTLNLAKEKKVNQIVLAGGVSANSFLRKSFMEKAQNEFEIIFPPPSLCIDNAVMIACFAFEKYKISDFADLSLNAFSTKGLRII